MTKRQKAIEALFDKTKLYTLEQSLDIIKKAPKVKFDETVEVSVKLGIDTKAADQQVRGTVLLPHGTGKTVRVVVVVEGEDVRKAKEAGAIEAGGQEIIEKIEKGWMDFDRLISVPSMMKPLSRLGKILGPKGLMPNPKSGTVTNDVTKAVKEMMAGRIEYRADKASDVHVIAGKISFKPEALKENISAIMDALIKVKPASAKGQYLKSVAVTTSMGPGVRLDVNQFQI